MKISNPGLLDGSVTTAKLADGSVTTAKCSDTDFLPDYTGFLVVKEQIGSYYDTYPGLVLANAALTEHWSFIENTTDGTQQSCEIYDQVHGIDVIFFNTDGSISLHTPLAVGSGGTGAASLAAAKISTQVANGSVTAQTTTNTSVASYVAPSAGYYLVGITVVIHNTSGSADTMTGEVYTTIGGTNYSAGGTGQVNSSANQAVSGTVLVYADSGATIHAGVEQWSGNAGDDYDCYVSINRIS